MGSSFLCSHFLAFSHTFSKTRSFFVVLFWTFLEIEFWRRCKVFSFGVPFPLFYGAKMCYFLRFLGPVKSANTLFLGTAKSADIIFSGRHLGGSPPFIGQNRALSDFLAVI